MVIRDDRLAKGCPSHQYKPYWRVTGSYLDLVALIQERHFDRAHSLFSKG
jgi:hypothetical protein